MSAPDRLARVNEILKREIADSLERLGGLNDCLISVTAVKTSSDLRNATVLVSVLGGDDDTKEKVVKFLYDNRPVLQGAVARNIVLKFTPRLSFRVVKNIEQGDNVLALLEKLDHDA